MSSAASVSPLIKCIYIFMQCSPKEAVSGGLEQKGMDSRYHFITKTYSFISSSASVYSTLCLLF